MDFKVFEPQIDKWGYIVHGPMHDGGDTCANHFTALYCKIGSQADLERSLLGLVRGGIPIRHPDPTKWYSRTDRTSRDQLTPYLCFVAESGSLKQKLFTRLWLQHAKLGWMWAWNTRKNGVIDTPWKLPDFCGPDIWAVYARGLLNHSLFAILVLPVLWLICWVGDLQNFLAVVSNWIPHKLGRKFGPTYIPDTLDHDARNLTLKVHFAAHNWPTWFARFSWWLWAPLGQEAAISWWSQPGEPTLYKAIANLNIKSHIQTL